MSYIISPYAYQMAKKLGVSIKPSTLKNKKIDVFENNKKIASIGAKGMKDYQIYLKEEGKEFADERRRLYRIRHKKDLNTWSSKLLW
jgi:hypothetical protein